MAYFNNAFQKVFLGTTGFTGKAEGQLGTTGNIFAKGEFGFVDPKTWSIIPTDDTRTGCCPLVLVSGAVQSSDKIGPFHGGYQESNKSKVINPKYVSKFYKVPSNEPQRNIIHVGSTLFNTSSDCIREYLCNETYYLRVDVKGSPALRYLNHNGYLTLAGYTGCCTSDVAPEAVDSTLLMISWAKQIVESPIISPFIQPVVTTEAGNLLYAPGTDTAFMAAVALALGVTVDTWDNYVSTGHTVGTAAGLTLNGAYEDTKFGDCTFQLSDFYEKEPLKLYASLEDIDGNPCEFEGLCVVTECEGLQAQGLGETVLRDFILSESYRQNFLHSDLRIREITQGNDLVSAVDRTLLYDKYYLLHSVPRFNNPSSTFDTDQYLLEIVVPAGSNQTVFEDFVESWLDACGNCVELETYGAITTCAPTIPMTTSEIPD
jgi:hypothetical protein